MARAARRARLQARRPAALVARARRRLAGAGGYVGLRASPIFSIDRVTRDRRDRERARRDPRAAAAKPSARASLLAVDPQAVATPWRACRWCARCTSTAPSRTSCASPSSPSMPPRSSRPAPARYLIARSGRVMGEARTAAAAAGAAASAAAVPAPGAARRRRPATRSPRRRAARSPRRARDADRRQRRRPSRGSPAARSCASATAPSSIASWRWPRRCSRSARAAPTASRSR